MPASTALDRAIAEGAARAFAKRAAALRKKASDGTARITDQWGRAIAIPSPEAIVMARTAVLLDECAAEAIKGADTW